jgi:ferredoxin
MRNTIFWFSGTGNSLKVARDIAAGVEHSNLMSIAASIDKISDFSPRGVVGFVFPVYYCGLPQIVRKFVSLINLEHASYIYVACTYGSTGGNAGCIAQAKKILKEKGKTLNAAFYVKSVDNFILWTWDVPPVTKHAALHENARKKSAYIASIVSAEKNHCDRSITEYIGPLIFRYDHFYNTVNFNDTAFHSTESCTSCGLCADVCPTNNIYMSDDRPVWKSETCQRCLACLHLCPAACIQYGTVTAKRQRYKNPYITVNELKRNDLWS